MSDTLQLCEAIAFFVQPSLPATYPQCFATCPPSLSPRPASRGSAEADGLRRDGRARGGRGALAQACPPVPRNGRRAKLGAWPDKMLAPLDARPVECVAYSSGVKLFNQGLVSVCVGLRLILLAAALILFSAGPVSASPPSAQSDFSLSGKALAQRVYDRENGNDSLARATMELIGKGGRKRVRDLTIYSKDTGSLRKTLIRFHSPADIAGTGFLSIEKEGGDTEQFLYLPALRRTRRVVSSQKARRFVNTDFTYEDMERRSVEDSDHRIAGEEKIGTTDCWVLNSRPKIEADSQYSLIKSRIAKKIYVPVLVEYFDKKGNLMKKYRVNRLENIQNIWTETEVVMEDLRKKHRTILKTKNVVYNTNLNDRVFTRRNLENW